MNRELMFSSETDMWSTPQYLFDMLNSEFNFDIDVCATKENAKCKKYYTINDDALSQPWDDMIVWCNPPYGRQIKKWVKKAYESKSTVVMLLPARTDTSWFHDYIYNKAEIRFIRGRLKFGDSTENAPFPSMIVIFKNKIEVL